MTALHIFDLQHHILVLRGNHFVAPDSCVLGVGNASLRRVGSRSSFDVSLLEVFVYLFHLRLSVQDIHFYQVLCFDIRLFFNLLGDILERNPEGRHHIVIWTAGRLLASAHIRLL